MLGMGLLVAAIILLLSIIIVTSWLRGGQTLPRSVPAAIQAGLTLQTFKRTGRTAKGEPWELIGRSSQYSMKDGGITIDTPHLVVTRTDGPVTLDARQAIIRGIVGGSIDTADLIGAIHVVRDTMHLYGERGSYAMKEGMVHITEAPRVVSGRLEITARELTLYTKSSQAIFSGSVRTVIAPADDDVQQR